MEVIESVAQGDPNGPPMYSLGFMGAIEEIKEAHLQQGMEEIKGEMEEHNGIFEEKVEGTLSTTLFVDDLIDIRAYDGPLEVQALKEWIKTWVACIIDVQEEWGIEANEDKSVLLVELRGKNSKKVRAQ